MESYFYLILSLLVLAELVKGLSANGTPPVLQRFSWQIDLAYFMWMNIVKFRIILFLELWRSVCDARRKIISISACYTVSADMGLHLLAV